MRVVHLADYASPYRGSFVPMLEAVHREAGARGWAFEAIFAANAAGQRWFGDLAAAGVAVRAAPRRSSTRELATFVAGLLAERDEPTVVHTHFTRFDLPAVLAARHRPDVPVLWHLHSPFRGGVGPIARNVVKLGLGGRRVSRILCVGPELARGARHRLAPRRRVLVFPNAIDVSRFPLAGPQERDAARRELELPADRPVLAHFGWDWHRKGGDLFLRAIDRLREQGVDVIGVTVRGGEEAIALRDHLGLEEAVRVLPALDRTWDLHAAADVFVAPSRAEGAPLAILEALAAGTPVVSSDLRDHLAVGELAACRVAPLAADALADSIKTVLRRDPDQRAREAAAAHSHVASRFGLGDWAAGLFELYVQALGERGACTPTGP
jgi:glycosyltransferase involved in cell wall biosynthesis